MPAVAKPRLLWVAVKLFDKSVDKATWLETMANLDQHFDVQFLTGWRDAPVEILVGGHRIDYFPQFGTGLCRKFSRRLMMKGAVHRRIACLSPQVILLNCLDIPSMAHAMVKSREKQGCKIVLDVRTLPTGGTQDPAWKGFGEIMLLASRHFDGITYITDEIRRYCITRYELPAHANAVWTSGVNADIFCPAQEPLEDESFRLIYHGGIISVSRGLDCLIQAIDRVRDLDVHLTLISSLREPAAIKWIDSLDLRERVSLMDTIPHSHVPGEIQKCHAGILPFPNRDVWNTSSPIKLFEYLSCGKPVIVTDIPAHRNVLENRPFAFFASDASPEALAAAIRQAYAARKTFAELGSLARRQVLEQHTWAHQAQQLGVFLEHILSHNTTV